MKDKWRRFTGKKIDDLESTLLIDVAEAPNRNLTFYIGGDSQFHKGKVTYVVAIIMVMGGKGARGYYRSFKSNIITTLRQRLFMETYQAVEVAIWINPILEKLGYEIAEIHTDLNPNPEYLSHDMVQTCLGYISGFGFEGAIKPEAWASSIVADYRTKPKKA